MRKEVKELKKVILRPWEINDMYGIPEGSLANMRWSKKGPRYFRKPGGRGIFYLLTDVEDWLTSQPVQTTYSVEAQ
jgi:hypothetical protein